jgi:hypothetical protein
MAKLDNEFTMTTGNFSIDYETREVVSEVEVILPKTDGHEMEDFRNALIGTISRIYEVPKEVLEMEFSREWSASAAYWKEVQAQREEMFRRVEETNRKHLENGAMTQQEWASKKRELTPYLSDFFVCELDPGDKLVLTTMEMTIQGHGPEIDATKYPHKCDCGSPSWNGIKVQCSNPECMHYDGME